MRSGGRTCRGDDEGCTLTNPEGRNTFQLNCLTVYSILSILTYSMDPHHMSVKGHS